MSPAVREWHTLIENAATWLPLAARRIWHRKVDHAVAEVRRMAMLEAAQRMSQFPIRETGTNDCIAALHSWAEEASRER